MLPELPQYPGGWLSHRGERGLEVLVTQWVAATVMSPPGGPDVKGVRTGCHDRQRDLLPLPEGWLLSSSRAPRSSKSRSIRRRLECRLHTAEMAEEAVTTLNEMHGGPRGPKCSNSRPTAGQAASLAHILNCAHELGSPPEDMDGQGALAELLAKQSYSGVGAPVAIAPFDVELISLPAEGSRPVGIVTARGYAGRKIVEGLLSKVLL